MKMVIFELVNVLILRVREEVNLLTIEGVHIVVWVLDPIKMHFGLVSSLDARDKFRFARAFPHRGPSPRSLVRTRVLIWLFGGLRRTPRTLDQACLWRTFRAHETGTLTSPTLRTDAFTPSTHAAATLQISCLDFFFEVIILFHWFPYLFFRKFKHNFYSFLFWI